MHHFHTSFRAVATIGFAAVVSVSTGAAATVSGAASGATSVEVAAPSETPLVRIEPARDRVAGLSNQAARISAPAESAQSPSPDVECIRSDSRSRSGADRRLEQIADVLRLSGEQIAELRAIQMLADHRFTPHISQSDLAESIRAVLSEDQADCLIALLQG